MAVTVYGVTPATWDSRLDFLTPKQIMKIALEGAPAVQAAPVAADSVLALLCANRMGLGWDIEVSAKTTASETATVLDLTAAGVTFPAGFNRVVEIDTFITGDNANEGSWARTIQHVVGGTTPILRVTQVSFTVGASGATLPPIVAGNLMFSTSAGIASGAGAILALSANNVLAQVVSAEAEIVNFFLRIKVGRLQPVLAGV